MKIHVGNDETPIGLKVKITSIVIADSKGFAK